MLKYIVCLYIWMPMLVCMCIWYCYNVFVCSSLIIIGNHVFKHVKWRRRDGYQGDSVRFVWTHWDYDIQEPLSKFQWCKECVSTGKMKYILFKMWSKPMEAFLVFLGVMDWACSTRPIWKIIQRILNVYMPGPPYVEEACLEDWSWFGILWLFS